MSKLIAFGCSLTYGAGLPDCWDKKLLSATESPSNLAWPALLGNKLNLDVVNLSRCGNSNKHIWLSVLKYKNFSKKDIVIIAWSLNNRFAIIKDYNAFNPAITLRLPDIKLGKKWLNDRGLNKKMIESYFHYIYDDYDSKFDLFQKISHIDLYLKAQGIQKIYHTSSFEHEISIPPDIDISNWYNPNIIPLHIMEEKDKFEPALDGMHPGEDAQRYFADKMFEYIRQA